MIPFPPSVKACLWSYDTDSFDLARDKQRIIFNVLNYGSDSAARWLFHTYPRTDLAEVVKSTPRSEWSHKSLALWSLIFSTHPQVATRSDVILQKV